VNVLHAEVSDHGQWRAERAEGPGHGLGIMRAFADAVAVDRRPSGTIVRLTFSLASSAVPATAAAAAPSHDERLHRFVDAGAPVPTGIRDVHFQEARFAIGQLEGIPVLNVSGDVDLDNAGMLAEQLESAARLDKRAVIVSLAGATFFDSTAIHVLLRFERRLATNRQRLLLAVARDRPARRIIDLTGLSHAIPVFETAEDAVAGLR